MPSRKGQARSRIERAEYLFSVYAALGPDRSLRRVLEICNDVGTQWAQIAPALGLNPDIDIRVAMSTIAAYSTEFKWQERIANLNLRDIRVYERGIDVAMQAAQRHAQTGMALQQLGSMGIRAKMAQTPTGQSGVTADSLSGTEIARLIDVGARLERTALEQQHQHINSADTAAQFLHQHLPPVVVRVLDFLGLQGDDRAVAVGFLAEQIDALILSLYQQFRVEPPDYLLTAPVPLQLPEATA